MFDLREIEELITIVASFPATPSPEERQRLVATTNDHEHPDRGTSKKGRNAQYELVVRAFFARAGLAVSMPEPDILVSDTTHKCAIAAKRLQTAAGLDDRLREGLRQLKTPTQGIVAINVDQAVRAPNHFLMVEKREQLLPIADQMLRDFVKPRLRAMERRVLRTGAVGIVLSLNMPMRVDSEGIVGASMHWHFVRNPSSDADIARTRDFIWEAIVRASTNAV